MNAEAPLKPADVADVSSPAPAPAALGFWATVKDALRGEAHHDYTQGPVGRAIFLLAVPMVLEMAMESVFAVVDVFFVGRLGPAAIATVGLTESMLMILYAVAMGLSVGTMALVARRTGEKDPEAASKLAVQAIGVALVVSLPVAAAGVLFARPLLAVMGGSPWVIEHGYRYTQVMLGGNAAIVLLFLINAIFRGAGDAAVAMRALWLANAINIALAPCLIFGLGPFPELGVMGAGVATTVGRGTGVLYQLYRLTRPAGRVRVTRAHLRLDPTSMLQIFKLGGGAVLQMLLGTTSWVALTRIVAQSGDVGVAGYMIAMRIIMFALLPSAGLANAAATLVGQNLGAKRPDRAEESVWRAGRYNAVFLGAAGAVLLVIAPWLGHAFSADVGAAKVATDGLRIVSLGYVFYAYGMVLEQAFNGAGDTFTPTILNLICFWAIEVPLAHVLANVLGMGPNGVFISIAVAFSALAVISVVLFRRGRWKTRQV